MKKILILLLFYTCSPFIWGSDLKSLLQQTQDSLQQEVHQIDEIPASLRPVQLPNLCFSNHLQGAVAEYRADKNTIYISRRVLKQWHSRLSSEKKSNLQDTLSQCLIPVYVHELSHARDYQQGQSHGFVWPITLEDEFIATVWQAYLIQQYQRTHLNYQQHCTEWLPLQRKDFVLSSQGKANLYAAYSTRLGDNLPPPLSPENIVQLQESGQIIFADRIYRPRRRKLSFRSFIKRGGNWLLLSPSALKKLSDSAQYAVYFNLLQQRNNELNAFIAHPL